MSEPTGQIGAYTIETEIGRGGMGVVYLARDSRLDRRVAIKALPEHLAEDVERLSRFEREAKTLAQLNHPNVAGIHGVEVHEDRRYLVLEYIEGPTLAERLDRGALEIDEALELCAQIASGLESAHSAGVIHRDLKPSNIKITPEGRAVVLDFGLAKATEHTSSSSSGASETETLTTPAGAGFGADATPTMPGAILGTAPYMSPEQARGRSVDKRTDVWSFGCVLYECLTGATLFAGETATDSIGAILHKDIDLQHLPAGTPVRVRQLLARMLERSRDDRLRDLGDAMLELKAARGEMGRDTTASVSAKRLPTWTMLVSSAAIAALVAAAGVWSLGPERAATPALESAREPARRNLTLTQLTDTVAPETRSSISPDGATIVYSRTESGVSDVFSQRVGGFKPVNLTADFAGNDTDPALSPDGQQIVFRSERLGGGLFVMGATGESPRRLTEFGFEPAWSPDGESIVFCTESASDPTQRSSFSELWTCRLDSGEPQLLFDGDGVRPQWSPDGSWIAFWGIDRSGQRDIFVLPATGGKAFKITDDPHVDYGAVWSPDGSALYFNSNRSGAWDIWRVAIDPETGGARAEPEALTVSPVTGTTDLSFTRDGSRLAFSAGSVRQGLYRLDLAPDSASASGPARRLSTFNSPIAFPAISSDGASIAYTNVGASVEDIFVMSSDGTGRRRLTNDEARDRTPVWHPSRRELFFSSNRADNLYQPWIVGADTGRARALFSTGRFGAVAAISPDGERLLLAGAGFTLGLGQASDPDAPLIPLPEWNGAALTVGDADWSPDGSRIVLAQPVHAGSPFSNVLLLDLAAQSYELLGESERVIGVRFLPDGERLVLFGGLGIEILDLETGNRETIYTETSGYLTFSGADVSPDGTWLCFVRFVVESDVWMIEFEDGGLSLD